MRKVKDCFAKVVIKMKERTGEWYTDNFVKVAIAVVLGGILIAALIAIFGNEASGLIGVVANKLREMFSI